MNPRPFLLAAALALALSGSTSCAASKIPPVVDNLVGIAVDCGKVVATNLLETEAVKIGTDLTALDFTQADTDVRKDVSDLVSHGMGVEAAWQAVACVVEDVINRAQVHSAATNGDDEIASRQITNGKRWIDVHQVVYSPGASTGAWLVPDRWRWPSWRLA
jgi:hypothetical protein